MGSLSLKSCTHSRHLFSLFWNTNRWKSNTPAISPMIKHCVFFILDKFDKFANFQIITPLFNFIYSPLRTPCTLNDIEYIKLHKMNIILLCSCHGEIMYQPISEENTNHAIVPSVIRIFICNVGGECLFSWCSIFVHQPSRAVTRYLEGSV